MNAVPRVVAALPACATSSAFAAADERAREFGITAHPTIVRGGENCSSASAVADRGPLYLKARYSYVNPRSSEPVFVGSIGATF
jgi:hypothetical protein